MLPLLSYQKLMPHVDGTPLPPPTNVEVDSKSVLNPAYVSWADLDQKTFILLNSSLTEEAAAEVLGLPDSRSIWTALQAAYSSSSVERIHSLRDSLRQMQKGTNTIFEYGRKFKTICDQLAAIDQPVDDMDKIHWFLCGLGSSFETFSIAIRTSRPSPAFRDLLSQAKNHEIFLQSMHGFAAPTVAVIS